MSVIAYWNGSFVNPDEAHVPIDERGHQFGDGVYEVVRVYGGRPFLLDMHLERLEYSLAHVDIANPHLRSQWTEIIHEAIRRSGEAEALVYWQVTRGVAPRGHLFPSVQPSVSLTVRPFQSKPSPSASLLALPDERWANAFVKTINLLPNAIAKETAHQSGATEALLIRNGLVTEGSSSNAWFVRNHQIITAPANRWILNGISRRFVLQLAQKLGYEVVEQPLRWHDIGTVDEVFMTGTTIEVLPVQEVRVDEVTESELDVLPDIPAQRLIRDIRNTRTVWLSEGRSQMAGELQQAYQEEVERFRHHAESVVL